MDGQEIALSPGPKRGAHTTEYAIVPLAVSSVSSALRYGTL